MKHPMFTEMHELFRHAVRDFVKKELAPHTEEWEKAGEIPRWVFERMGELGYLGLRYPKEYGGQDADFITSVILQEELARCGMGGLGMAVAVQNEMSTPPIFKFGTEEVKRRYLVPAIQGKKIGAIVLTEPNAGSDLASIETWAKPDGKDWIINGRKTFITNGASCDFGTVLVRTSREQKRYMGMSVFIVDTDTPGFCIIRKLDKLGMRCADTVELAFDNCRVPGENLLGELGKGFYQIMWELQCERIAASANAVGRAQMAFELALEYAQQREQFGHPIADFQVIRHRLADMATELEAARQLVYYAAWLFQNYESGYGEYPVKEISMAKLKSAQAGFKICDDALQIFGSYGYVMEAPIQRYWRDIRATRIGAGNDETMKDIIARQLIPKK